jgi:hypothetical protein
LGADEVGTLTALKSRRRDLIDPAIAMHHGRIVKTTGDGVLVEFPSVVDAVGCAVAVQRGMASRNSAVAADRRIVLRVGINIGDIIIDGDDIFGDGVNIAARLQTLCEPGGLCISRAANDQIRDKLSLAFADRGEQTVKNISHAVGVFALAAKEIEALPETPGSQAFAGLDVIAPEPKFEQKIQFCLAPDGVQLAYSRIGQGPPLGEDRKLDDSSRIRSGKSHLASSLSRTRPRSHAYTLRRAWKRAVGSRGRACFLCGVCSRSGSSRRRRRPQALCVAGRVTRLRGIGRICCASP